MTTDTKFSRLSCLRLRPQATPGILRARSTRKPRSRSNVPATQSVHTRPAGHPSQASWWPSWTSPTALVLRHTLSPADAAGCDRHQRQTIGSAGAALFIVGDLAGVTNPRDEITHVLNDVVGARSPVAWENLDQRDNLADLDWEPQSGAARITRAGSFSWPGWPNSAAGASLWFTLLLSPASYQ